MPQIQNTMRQNCTLLAVLCGEFAEKRQTPASLAPDTKRLRLSYPFPELASSGRLEVHTLINPTLEQFREAQQAVHPVFLYLQGQQQENEEEIGTLVWGDTDLSDPQMFVSLITPPFPTMVYLEVPTGEKLAQSLHSKGIPYVVYWRNLFSSYTASHFRHALMSVIQSSCSHTWDAFQLAHASFRLYCVRNNHVQSVKLGPCLLGDAPKTNVIPAGDEVNEEQGCSEGFPDIRIYDEDVSMKFLLCGVPCTLDACLLGALEDGLNALLNIEIRASKLQNRASAHPPLQAEDLPHGVVTMRCDITTCSSAHVSFLVSCSAQTCFDDQLLGSRIKNEIIEKRQLVRALLNNEDNKPSSYEPLPSMCVACGASTFEVWITMPKWAAQEDFLKDVMQFLLQRGHIRLVPQGGLAEFPDAVLNSKRLDLYNLYKEVVYRGGFYVGNGINWKGQIFSKMHNHTVTNKMTGVGNTLKRHYETYLLEYELAHDDIDGECCLICHSGALGDWVNCGLCGEWAHLGCDRRKGLSTFKDYSKADGMEYICPQCSLAKYKPPLPAP
ncbi:AT-rich interactive domain-containing protein 4 isoform X2 [Zea mays]|uniref:ARID domain-containing protein n=1 Tax=Zea mays TaxID=4577 RepID=A0A804LVY3_MAIZE|nr:uncharacterized protein LOC100191457 isoform X2 [Zea mays]XP_035820863.1 uncharacterized protein LOC100191457 isoform X2 [Zea mays]